MAKENKKPAPPQMSPYVFTVLLLGFGLWCFWDGWITNDPKMIKHSTFNRVLSGVLLPLGIYDYFKIKKREEIRNQLKINLRTQLKIN